MIDNRDKTLFIIKRRAAEGGGMWIVTGAQVDDGLFRD